MATITNTLPIKSIPIIEVLIIFLRNKILKIYDKDDKA